MIKIALGTVFLLSASTLHAADRPVDSKQAYKILKETLKSSKCDIFPDDFSKHPEQLTKEILSDVLKHAHFDGKAKGGSSSAHIKLAKYSLFSARIPTGDGFYFYSSRRLESANQINDDRYEIVLSGTKKLDQDFGKALEYTYHVVDIDNNDQVEFLFTLQYFKLKNLKKIPSDKLADFRFCAELAAKVSQHRPSSITLNDPAVELQLGDEKTQKIEAVIAKFKKDNSELSEQSQTVIPAKSKTKSHTRRRSQSISSPEDFQSRKLERTQSVLPLPSPATASSSNVVFSTDSSSYTKKESKKLAGKINPKSKLLSRTTSVAGIAMPSGFGKELKLKLKDKDKKK